MYPCSQCHLTYTSNSLLVSHMKRHTREKPYQCSHCGKAFSTNNGLKRHQKTHTGEKPYECINCGKAYALLSNLKVHYRTHTGEKPYKCKYCSKAFSRNEICVIHTRIHTGEKPFRCNICTKAFYSKGKLVEHIRIHTGERPYKCTQCYKAFAIKNSLRDHELAHNQAQNGEKPYQCSQCNKTFALIRYLRNHVRRKHNTIAMVQVNRESHTSENHEQSNNSNISINTNSNATNAAICIMAYASACLSEKVKPNSFQRVMDQYFVENNIPVIKHPVPDKDIIEFYSTKYMASNLGGTPSNTESVVPDKSPSGDSNLNNINNYHKSSSHEMMVLDTNVDDDNSLCHVSNSDFESAIEDNISAKSNSNSQANNHVNNTKKTHQCSYCDRNCFSKNDLISHVRIHTGEKPYKCNQCGWAFAQKYNLITHQKKIHGDHKNYSYHEMISLDTNVDDDHSLFHVSNSDFQSPIKVKISGESNTNSQENDIIKHPKTDTSKKTYQCCYCGKYCDGNTGLMRHIRIHTGERPYKCNQCGHAFARKHNLTTHQKKVHGFNQKPSSHEIIEFHSTKYVALNLLSTPSNTESVLDDADQSLCHVSNSDFQSPIDVKISEKSYSNSQEINRIKHLKTDSKDKTHKCSHCDKSFHNSSNLTRHIRIHTGENLKPYKCSHCDMACSSSFDLVKHMRTHTGEKPYICSLCNYAFVQKSNLTMHQKKVHGETILTQPM